MKIDPLFQASPGRTRYKSRTSRRLPGVSLGTCRHCSTPWRRVSPVAEQPDLVGDAQRLATPLRLELGKDAVDVVLHRLHRDVQAAAYLLVAASGRHPAEHLALARGERLAFAAIDLGVLAFELDDARHH